MATDPIHLMKGDQILLGLRCAPVRIEPDQLEHRTLDLHFRILLRNEIELLVTQDACHFGVNRLRSERARQRAQHTETRTVLRFAHKHPPRCLFCRLHHARWQKPQDLKTTNFLSLSYTKTHILSIAVQITIYGIHLNK